MLYLRQEHNKLKQQFLPWFHKNQYYNTDVIVLGNLVHKMSGSHILNLNFKVKKIFILWNNRWCMKAQHWQLKERWLTHSQLIYFSLLTEKGATVQTNNQHNHCVSHSNTPITTSMSSSCISATSPTSPTAPHCTARPGSPSLTLASQMRSMTELLMP